MNEGGGDLDLFFNDVLDEGFFELVVSNGDEASFKLDLERVLVLATVFIVEIELFATKLTSPDKIVCNISDIFLSIFFYFGVHRFIFVL